MAQDVKILIKRTSSYYSDATTKTVNPNVGHYILEFAEPMYLKDVGWVVIGEGAEYETQQEAEEHTSQAEYVTQNPITKRYIGGPTVEELVKANKYYSDAKHTELYGNPTFQYLDSSGTKADIPVSNNGTLIANTKFVHDVVNTLDGNIGTTPGPAAGNTLVSLSQTDGKVTATFGLISIPYTQVTGAAPDKTSLPKEAGTGTGTGGAAAGISNNWSPSDHIHPHDTTKADLASPNFTGTAKYNGVEIATQGYVATALAAKSVVENKSAVTSGTLYVTGVTGNGATPLNYHTGVTINASTGVIMGAAWNDFAEYRKCQGAPGTVVCETGKGDLVIASERLQPGAAIISDTYGMIIGDKKEGNQPIAVAGRVLALYAGEINDFKPGMPVCAGPFGRIYPMTREEIKEYPEAIVGYVSEIPNYEEWNNIKIANRIWIKVK